MSLSGLAAPGCGAQEVEPRTQSVTISSYPPGATVYLEDAQGKRPAGATPISVEGYYQEQFYDYNDLNWIWTLLAAGGIAGGAVLLDIYSQGQAAYDACSSCTGNEDGWAMLPGLLLTVGGGAGFIASLYFNIDGDIQQAESATPINGALKLQIEKSGFAPFEHELVLPLSVPEYHAKLTEAAAAPSVPGPAVPPPPDPGPGTPPEGPKPRVDPSAGDLIAGSPQRNAYAFVVGIEHYRDVPAAPSARADAERFAGLARSTLGLPNDQVRVALDERAGIVDIRKGLKWLKSSVPVGGRAYFFFAGHGAPEAAGGTPYLLPYDGDAKDLQESAIELQEVLASLEETSGGQALAIVDACFSGAGGRSVLPEGARPLVRVQRASTGAKVALFSASTGAEISGPDGAGKGGLFTSTLVDALGRATADIDGNGDVTLGELATWVVPRVKRQASELGREQTPGLTLGAGLKAEEFVLGAGLGKK